MNNWTAEMVKQHNDRIAKGKSNKAGGTGNRKRAVIKEQQDDYQRQANHKPEKAEMDGVVRPKFVISVTFNLSTKQLRDVPGMLETACDCLVASGRQLSGVGDRKGVMQVRKLRDGRI